MSALPSIPSQTIDYKTITSRVDDSAVTPLRPLTIGETIDLPIKLWRDNFWLIITPIALIFTPFTLIMYWSGSDTIFKSPMAATETLGNLYGVYNILEAFGALAMTLTSYLLLEPLVKGSIQWIAHKRLTGKEVSLGKDISHFLRRLSLKYILRIWGVTFICAIPIALWIGILSLLMVFNVAASFSSVGETATIIIGVLGAVIAFPVTALVYSFFVLTPMVTLVENLGFVAALKRSLYLVKGNFLRIFGIALSIMTVYQVVGSTFGVILSMGALAAPVDWYWVVTASVQIFMYLLIWPVQTLVEVVIYRDCLIVREGYDLLALAGKSASQHVGHHE